MKKPAIPANEKQRILALEKYQILDTAADQEFDDITALAASICQTPIAVISLVDKDRQWFKSKIGIDAVEAPRDLSFCGHAIHDFEIFVVPDAHADDRFADNPLVTGNPHVRFYAGAPLTAPDGSNLGTLCVIDNNARKLLPAQLKSLQALSRVVVGLLERRKAEHELEQQTKFLSAVMSELPALVSYLDTNFAYQFTNGAYERWFGVPGKDLLGKTVSEVLGKEIFEMARPYMEKALLGERQDFELSLPSQIRGTAVNKHVRVNYVPDRNAAGEVCGIFAITSDLTSLMTAETQRGLYEMKLIASSKMAELGEMAGGIAHEINTPLGIILGTTENLKMLCEKGPVDLQTAFPFLDKIESTTERIAKITQSLLMFSKNTEEDPMVEASLAVIAEDTLTLCRERFKDEGIELRVNVPGDIRLACRPSQISQVLLNLLSNAFDAVRDRPERWIALEATQSGERIQFTITDSGPGVPADVADKIMQPFFTTKEVGKGTGLGLSVAYGIAEAHHGKIAFLKEAVRTTFRVELPGRRAA